MNKIIATVLLAISPAFAFAGPFGINFGADISELDATPSGGSGVYRVNPPNPHQDFATYTVYTSPTWGVCKILAYSREIPTSIYGNEIVAAHKNFKERLIAKYGKPTFDINSAKSGSAWAKPKYFMMALLKKERDLVTYWTEKLALPEDIKAIVLDTLPINLQSAMLLVGYEGIHRTECIAENNKLSDSTL